MPANLPLLFAQAADAVKNAADVVNQAAPVGVKPLTPFQLSMFYGVMVFIAVVLPFILAHYLAQRLRMYDYGMKIGIVLCSILCSLVICAPMPKPYPSGWPPKLGIDLNGGAILVYKVNLEGAADEGVTPTKGG